MSSTGVFIGRLSYLARESDVERFFKGYGRLRSILLKTGYAFVEFDDARLVFLTFIYFNESQCTL